MKTPAEPLLAVSGLRVAYGPILAVRGVDLHVGAGEVVGIVGPNGAGKSSLLGAIAGVVAPAAGLVHFAGKDLAALALEEVVGAGIALVPEGRHIFSSLTVAENLRLGGASRKDPAGLRRDMDRFYATFPILGARRQQPAGQLSGGEQQQLAIARALLSRPKLLMLDEPSLGLAPIIVDQVYAIIRSIRDDGVSVLLVEQNADRAFSVCDRMHVMNGGLFALSGAAAELRGRAEFDSAYFGVGMGGRAGVA
jgi:branched-chain amino acid transport system ATP-binding protein